MGCSKSSDQKKTITQKICIRKEESLKLIIAAFTLRNQKKSKVSRRKEIIKNQDNYQRNYKRETIEKIKETKDWYFEKIDKIDKLLDSLTNKM